MKLKNFKYEAINIDGKTVKGSFETLNQYTCLRYLESKNLKPVKLTETTNFITRLNQITISNVLNKKQLVFFLKQLGALLNAGISIVSALEILALQQNNKHIQRLYFELQQNITNGFTFSESLKENPKEFPEMLTQMIEIGEISGNLPDVILNMAAYYENQMRISASIISTIRMPIIYLGITLLIAVGMVLWVFPSITTLFSSFEDAELPGVTQFFLNTSDFIGTYILHIILIILAIVAFFYFTNKYSSKIKFVYSSFLLKTPIFGQLIQMYNQILIANTLSQMLSNGINSLYALRTIRKLIKNVVYRDLIDSTITNITDGKPFSMSFKENNFVDPIMTRMIETGENTGDIPTLMNNLSDYYNEMSDMRINKIKGSLQPILLIIIYTIIGIMLLAIMLPMLDLGGQI